MSTYKQPQKVPVIPGSGGGGYPQTEIGVKGVYIKGKMQPDAPKKQYMDMRGYGAATKGRKFLKD